MSEQEFATQRSRSPTYPYLTLPEAISLLEKFVQVHRFTKVPLSIALKDMGYSITSGTGARVAASITQYGLFEIDGSRDSRRVWPSDLARKIVLENPSKPGERLHAIQEAALKPEMHQWVSTRYNLSSEPMPAMKVLTYDLQRELGFPEKAAEAFAKEFMATYEYSQLGKFRPTIEEEAETQQPVPVDESPSRRQVSQPQASYDSSEMDELRNWLTEGKEVRLILPKKLNKTDFQLLANWLDYLKTAAMYQQERYGGDEHDTQQ